MLDMISSLKLDMFNTLTLPSKTIEKCNKSLCLNISLFLFFPVQKLAAELFSDLCVDVVRLADIGSFEYSYSEKRRSE